jgi:hypothetical protein
VAAAEPAITIEKDEDLWCAPLFHRRPDIRQTHAERFAGDSFQILLGALEVNRAVDVGSLSAGCQSQSG